MTVSGPPGLVIEDPIFPPTERLRLESVDLELPVWSGTVDVQVPFYAVGELASETRPLDTDSADIEVAVRYQACDDTQCFIPRSRTLKLDVPLAMGAMPNSPRLRGISGATVDMDWDAHMKRLVERKLGS